MYLCGFVEVSFYEGEDVLVDFSYLASLFEVVACDKDFSHLAVDKNNLVVIFEAGSFECLYGVWDKVSVYSGLFVAYFSNYKASKAVVFKVCAGFFL